MKGIFFMRNDVAVIFPDRFYDGLNSIKEEYEVLARALKSAEEELSSFRQDKEIVELEDKLRNTQRLSLHMMTESEQSKYLEFRKAHYAKCKNGGHYVVDLEGTGIGECIMVMCPVCGKKEDITDYEVW